jgi:predicted metal-dependent hydrolase
MNRQIFEYGDFRQEIYVVPENRQTFQLRVKPSMQVVVKHPKESSDEEVRNFLKRKYRWLKKQLQFFEQFQVKQNERDYVSGESFWYLGRQYQLKVVETNLEYVKLFYGKLEVGVINTLDRKRKQELVDRWNLDKRVEVFDERYEEMKKKFNETTFPKLYIEKMPKRWGSFRNKRAIVLHPLLIHAPKKCIDYVITHELCHMKHPHHSSDFFAYLETKYPKWQAVKDELEVRLGGYV